MGRLIRTAAVSAVSAVVLIALGASRPPGHSRPPARVAADAALVLSGDVDDRRTITAAALYREGAFPWIVLTGSGYGGDSAASLATTARRLGVPESALRLETSSTTTRENLMGALPIIRASGWKRVALVTSESHMGRAERVARKVLPDVEWVPVPVADPGPPGRIYRARLEEWLKLARYALHGWV